MNFKKTILLFLLFILGTNILFINNYSFVQKVISVRNEYIINHASSCQVLNIQEFVWNSFQNKKEIFYNNRFYDVKQITKKGNVIIASVIEDNFEKNIKDFFHYFIKKNKKESRYNLKYKISLYIIEKQHTQVELVLFEAKNKLNYFLSKKYSYYNFNIIKPPIFNLFNLKNHTN